MNYRRCQRHLTQDLKRKGRTGEEAAAFLAEMGTKPRSRLLEVF